MEGKPEQSGRDDLSVPEKILCVQDLRDDIARSSQKVELTPAQREGPERRLLGHDSDPGQHASWEELRRRLGREP